MTRRRPELLGPALALAAVLAVSLGACTAPPAPTPSPTPTAASTQPCENRVGTAVPDGLGPGDVVDSLEITPTGDASYPVGARSWRILYVTTGVDETDLQLVCGTVTAPAAGPAVVDGRARILNWSHGTVGIAQDCLPSSDPAVGLWGPMPGGIGAVAWGADLSKREGEASDGLLQFAVDQGWVVAAADYAPDSTYVVGKTEASAILDAARAATQLVDSTFADAPTKYDAVIWGHSQGGHAALWAGQLFDSYLAATHPSGPVADLTLRGVAALAPASNFITQPGQPGVVAGDGLADWEMHKNIGLDLPVAALQMQIGPALFSYIFGAWDALADGPAPAADAAFPAYPLTAGGVQLDAIATAEGAQTVATVKELCLRRSSAGAVQSAVEKYGDASANPMVVPEIWNLPAGYRSGEFFRGGLDATCAAPPTEGLATWCAWMLYNLPGPLGSNPFPKVPLSDGQPVPLFLAQGLADDIIHCQPAGGAGDHIPDAANCMTRALYDSLEPLYCIDGTSSLTLHGVAAAGIGGVDSPATHFSIPGEIAAKSIAGDELVFEGSPLQRFFSEAFDGSVAPGCSMVVS
ncbi:lipase family protein [Salinibacterium soli]|uniref:Lipase family protein n=1 Tax=Antiquaquibacter soli TaxID=3064523 RepID=A0ABT9BK56_9MICO|nr:lipase family protein [Protaetiibacter sp. WY-16]MDO7880823.1 lipase family protein [Protaetiibacter sp. WY-16]